MHPKIGTSAAQSLALLGATDPKLGMPLLVLILFYTKVLYSNNNCDANILVSTLVSAVQCTPFVMFSDKAMK